MDKIEKSAKTVEEAVGLALAELNTTEDRVEISVLNEGSKGFLGVFGGKDATVVVVKKFDPEEATREFLSEVFRTMNLEVEIELKKKDKQFFVNLIGDNMGVLIGKRGQTLDSLQYLVNLVVNKHTETYVGITLDTENYRQRRRETLNSLAYNLAKRVKATKESILLEPMSAYERRIIHSALQNDAYVKTFSKGDEPHRNVVIALK